MKLNNQLIITLPDFSRHFDFEEFWENRKQFVRDMHPSRVYYWNNELIAYYETIVDWISACDHDTTENLEESGLQALENLLGYHVDREKLSVLKQTTRLDCPVISVSGGNNLKLPEYNKTDSPVEMNYHKIEIAGNSGKDSIISIGTQRSITLKSGEFVFVTESNGMFIEFMPNHIENSRYEIEIISPMGEFKADLHVRNKFTGGIATYEKVISAALTEDGYLFIDSKGRLIIQSLKFNTLKYIFRHTVPSFYVKVNAEHAAILYRDGTVITTDSQKPLKRKVKVEL